MNKNPFLHGYYTTKYLKKLGFESVGENVKIAKNCTIVGLENISIGDNVQIDGGVSMIANTGFLKIGNYVHISNGCYLSCSGGVNMGDFSGLAAKVSIYSATDDYIGNALSNCTVPDHLRIIRSGLVDIGRHCLIGTNTVVLPNVTLGEGCSIGAMSLIPENKKLETWRVYFGSPVKPLKRRKKNALEMEKQIE